MGEPKSGFYGDPKGVRAKIRAELRGTHDIAKAAEMLLAEGEITYWQTPDGDEPIGSFVGAPQDKVAFTTLMNCYEFVHLCDMLTCCSTSHLRTTGVLGALFDKRTFKKWDGKEDIPRGSVVVITNSVIGSGPDKLYHVAVSVGGGNCVANSSSGNVHQTTIDGEFSVLGVHYGTIYFGAYPHCPCHAAAPATSEAQAVPVKTETPPAPVATPPPGTGGTGIVGIRVVDADTGEPVEGSLTISGLGDVPTTTQEIPPPKAPHVGDEALRNIVCGLEGRTVTIVHTPPPGYEVVRNSDSQTPPEKIVVTIKDVTYHTFYDRKKKKSFGWTPIQKVLAGVAALVAVALGVAGALSRGGGGGGGQQGASTPSTSAASPTSTAAPTTVASGGNSTPTSAVLVSGRYAGRLPVATDPAGHACCVHPATTWEVLQTRDTQTGAITIKLGGVLEGIDLTGPLSGTGAQFTANGVGSVAGRAGTEVSFTGTVTPLGGIHGTLTVGANRTLPTGQAVTFTVDMAKAP